MTETRAHYGDFRSNHNQPKLVLSDRPDMRLAKLGLVAAIAIVFLVLAIAIVLTFTLPLTGMERLLPLSLAGVVIMAVLGLPLIWYVSLVKATYTLTTDYIESKQPCIIKEIRTIPLTYVRDVTYSQNPLQLIFGISTITVSPTNGDAVVLMNIRDGERKREVIWNLVLSKSPGAQGPP
jgi:membrane protein YdbS with pleckstrin-like domain